MKFNFYKITLVTFFLLLFTSCKIIKTIKILKKGTVVQKNYKEEITFKSRAGLIVVKVILMVKNVLSFMTQAQPIV